MPAWGRKPCTPVPIIIGMSFRIRPIIKARSRPYPNVHKDYNKAAISSFNYLTSSFAATSPHVGIYNVAYDIWINGVATAGCTEVMIWTENYNQVPAGNKMQTVDLGGRTYDVWKSGGSQTYIAFVPTAKMTAGTIDLLEIFTWIISKNWIPSSSTIGQICFGVEIVSTNGTNVTFTFSDFSINTVPPNGTMRRISLGTEAASSNWEGEYYMVSGRRLKHGNSRFEGAKSLFWFNRKSDKKDARYSGMIVVK
jgi:hypothetical protein